MNDSQHLPPNRRTLHSPVPPVLAPTFMIAFWVLLGAAGGIRLMESIWKFIDFQTGAMSIAVPVGGVVGAVAGGLLGLISNPRLQVLLMAVFAGAAAGAVAGKLPWGDVGEIGGQLVGALVGGMAWAAWLFIDCKPASKLDEVNFLELESSPSGSGVSGAEPPSTTRTPS